MKVISDISTFILPISLTAMIEAKETTIHSTYAGSHYDLAIEKTVVA
jgi:hypothetical protein